MSSNRAVLFRDAIHPSEFSSIFYFRERINKIAFIFEAFDPSIPRLNILRTISSMLQLRFPLCGMASMTASIAIVNRISVKT